MESSYLGCIAYNLIRLVLEATLVKFVLDKMVSNYFFRTVCFWQKALPLLSSGYFRSKKFEIRENWIPRNVPPPPRVAAPSFRLPYRLVFHLVVSGSRWLPGQRGRLMTWLVSYLSRCSFPEWKSPVRELTQLIVLNVFAIDEAFCVDCFRSKVNEV